MNIGTRIQILLEEKEISRKDFARWLHINYSTAAGYIQNRRLPDCETLLKISILLNTSTDYLLGRTSIRYPKELHYSEDEGSLLSNFRNLSPDMQQILIKISACLPKNSPKDYSFWKQSSN